MNLLYGETNTVGAEALRERLVQSLEGDFLFNEAHSFEWASKEPRAVIAAARVGDGRWRVTWRGAMASKEPPCIEDFVFAAWPKSFREDRIMNLDAILQGLEDKTRAEKRTRDQKKMIVAFARELLVGTDKADTPP